MTNKKLSIHPAITNANYIETICQPLKHFNITYFAHVVVDSNKDFAALTNNAGFAEIYLKNKYYNNDIHLAKTNNLGKYVMWDTLNLKGNSHEMHEIAGHFGVKHTFTIIEKQNNANHFFHFANGSESNAINQVYLANYDLLQKFIKHFKENVYSSKELSRAYDTKLSIDNNAVGYTYDNMTDFENANRMKFLEDIYNIKLLSLENDLQHILFHRENSNPIMLAPQQMRCLKLLVDGCSAKEIGLQMNLSFRTINHYLDRIRKILGCRNSKEMISIYKSQLIL